MINPEYIKSNAELRKEIADLKIWLNGKEILEYNAWKKRDENSKDRTAMDKIIIGLKAQDEEWMEKEETLRNAEILLTTQNLVMEVLKKMISSVTYEAITMAQFNEYQKEMKVWFE